MASASGTLVPAIACLVAAHELTVRDVIHRFNEIGLRALDLTAYGDLLTRSHLRLAERIVSNGRPAQPLSARSFAASSSATYGSTAPSGVAAICRSSVKASLCRPTARSADARSDRA